MKQKTVTTCRAIRRTTIKPMPIWRQGYQSDRVVAGLPRPTDVIDAELVGVARPVRSRHERPWRQCSRRRCTATELMVHRVHQVLANAPRIRLTHVNVRWHDQSGRLTVRQIIIITMPRLLISPPLRPSIEWVTRLGTLVDQAGAADQHRDRDQ